MKYFSLSFAFLTFRDKVSTLCLACDRCEHIFAKHGSLDRFQRFTDSCLDFTSNQSNKELEFDIISNKSKDFVLLLRRL